MRLAGLSNQLRVSFNHELLEILDDDLLERFDVTGDPIKSGVSSVVFENGSGNIVAFIPGDHASSVARSKVRDLLPEIFAQEVIEIDGQKVSVVEMEKLRTLSSGEGKELDDLLSDWDLDHDSSMADALDDLTSRMKNDGVYHHDFTSRNVAWGSDGRLRLIDFDDISLPGATNEPHTMGFGDLIVEVELDLPKGVNANMWSNKFMGPLMEEMGGRMWGSMTTSRTNLIFEVDEDDLDEFG